MRIKISSNNFLHKAKLNLFIFPSYLTLVFNTFSIKRWAHTAHNLDSLVSKGLVSVSGKEPKQEYLAESPDILVKILDQNVKEAEKKVHEIKAIIPNFVGIFAGYYKVFQ